MREPIPVFTPVQSFFRISIASFVGRPLSAVLGCTREPHV